MARTLTIAQEVPTHRNSVFSAFCGAIAIPMKLWIFSTLFALGVIVGLSYLLIFPGTDNPRASESTPASSKDLSGSETDVSSDNKTAGIDLMAASAAERNEAASPFNPLLTPAELAKLNEADDQVFYAQRLRDEGDSYLIAGNFVTAAARFQKLQKLNGRFTSDVSIRLGICNEFDYQPGAAAAHYSRAIESRPPVNHRLLALAGLSRTWAARGNRSEALHILCELFLESLGPPPMPSEIQAQINYQLGQTLQDITLQKYHYDLSLFDGVAFHVTPPRMEALIRLLNELPPPPETAATSNEKKLDQVNAKLEPESLPLNPEDEVGLFSETAPRVTILQRPTDSVDLTLVDVQSSVQPIAALAKHLAAACELELLASPMAKQVIAGRSKSLDVHGVQVSLLLDSLLLPLNLFWYQDDVGLHLVSLTEPDSHAANFWSAATERTFRRFNVTFTGDYRRESVLLSRGNLRLIQNEVDRAANHYQELANLNPKEELLAKLFFNIGKVEMRLGRNENAMRHFYHTVDQTYDTAFQSTAYWLVGQLSLETNQLDDAVKASGRALSTAKIDQQKRLAALTMARAYLLNNQPFSANQVLFNNRRFFTGTKLEPTAAVLGSYARYVGVTDESSLHLEAERLLAAVATAPEESYESFIDIYIAARAYLRLGFQEQGIAKLTLAADSTTIDAWRRQILFELGIQLMIANEQAESISVFEFLIEGEPDQWLQRSLLQLTNLYVQQKRFDDCIAVCERLRVLELSVEDQQTTLTNMGRAYRELGQHHAAALCFAGILPKELSPNIE